MDSTSKFIYQIQAQYAGSGDIKKLQADLDSIGNIKAFEKIEAAISKTEQKLTDAEKKAADLQKRFEETGTKADSSAYSKAAAQVDRLSESLQKQNTKLESYAVELKKAGIAVTDLEASQARLGSSAAGKGNLLASENLLGVRSFSTIKAEIAGFEQAYATMAASGTKSDAELARAHEALAAKTKALNMEMGQAPGIFARASSGITSSLLGIGATMAGVFAIDKIFEYLGKISEISEEHAQLAARLRLTASSEKELHDIESQLFSASQKTGTAYANNADIFARMGIILIGAGVSSKSLISTIDVLNQTLVVSGANTEKQASFMSSFANAMDMGAIKAKQLKSMMSDNQEFVKLLAQSLGVTIEGLIKMAEAGDLTRDKVIAAIGNMAGQVGKDFASMPLTMQRATTEMHNSVEKLIGDSETLKKNTGDTAKVVEELAKTIDKNKPVIDKFLSLLESIKAQAIKGTTIVPIDLFASSMESMGKFEIMYLKVLSKELKIPGIDTTSLDEHIEKLTASYNKMFSGAKDGYKKLEEAAKDSGEKQQHTFAAVTPEIEEKYRKMAEKIKKIMQEISDSNDDRAKSIGDVRRSGMTADAAWIDLRAEADKYAASAQEAAAAGDFTTANKQMKEAISAAKSLSNEVDVNGEKMTARNAKIVELNKLFDQQNSILEEQNKEVKQDALGLDQATGGKLAEKLPEVAAQLRIVKDNSGEVNQSIQTLGGVFTNVFKTAADNVTATNTSMATLATTYSELQKIAASALIITSGDPVAAAALVKKEYQSIVEQIKKDPVLLFDEASVEQTQKIMTWVKDEQGKLVERATPYKDAWTASFNSFSAAGLAAISQLEEKLNELCGKNRYINVYSNLVPNTDASQYANGGQVLGLAGGGSVWQQFKRLNSYLVTSGSGLRDDVPAMLTKNEFVQPVSAVNYWGLDFMENVRQRRFPVEFAQMFASGGLVNSVPTINKTLSSSSSQTIHNDYGNLTVNFPANAAPADKINMKDFSKKLLAELQRQRRRSS